MMSYDEAYQRGLLDVIQGHYPLTVTLAVAGEYGLLSHYVDGTIEAMLLLADDDSEVCEDLAA